MKIFLIYKILIFFLYLLNQSKIFSYINLPIFTFHTTPPKEDETTKLVYYKYFHDNNIYTLLKLGLPTQSIVTKLNFDGYPFYIYYNRCEISSSFDISISKSFNKKPFQYLLTDIYTYTYLVDDYITFSEKESYIMKYLFSPVNNGTSEQKIEKLPYTCAEMGLKLPKPDLKSYNYSFIRELKLLNVINDYTIFIEYNKDNEDKGNLIIGIPPHEYNSNKYKFSQLTEINTVQISYDLYWQLRFNEIYFNIKEGNNLKKFNVTILDSGINHNLNVIIAPLEYMYLIEKEFFNKKNCNKNRLEKNHYSFDCASKQDILDFPTIYLMHRTLGYTFEITYEDVFIEYNGRYICLIWFDISSRNNWRFGKPFLKKYFFSFNVDKKMIGFYDMNNNEKKDEKANNYIALYIFVIILLLGVVVTLSFIITRKIFKIQKRNKKGLTLELSENLSIIDDK